MLSTIILAYFFRYCNGNLNNGQEVNYSDIKLKNHDLVLDMKL